MRRVVMTGPAKNGEPAKFDFRDVPEPSPGAGEVMIRIKRIGICGSDIHVYYGKHPFTPYPVVQGHEYSGVVEAVGDGVTKVKPGQKVTARPQIVCGKCRPCKRGDYNVCDNLKVRGFQAPGCAEDLHITEEEKVVALPDSLSFEEGAMVEPLSVATHSTKRGLACGRGCEGENVLVLGAAMIGNLVAQVAKYRGAKNVAICAHSNQMRIDLAKKHGIENAFLTKEKSVADAVQEYFGDYGYDLAFEATGSEQALNDAIHTIQKGGDIVVLSVFEEIPRVDMSVAGDNEKKLIGTLMYKHEDYEESVKLLSDGVINTEGLVTKHFKFEEYPDAYKYLEEHGSETMKVMIDMD